MTSDAASIDALLDRFLALHPKVIDLSLDRIERLLDRLGHPERNLPPVIHFAGTNGKGSTLAFCRAALEAAGNRVHAYTSPHLVRFNERIALGAAGGGAPIADETLAAVLREAENANAGEPITFFEITTAAAFLAFARAPGDILLLETGLGGRLDATNLVDRPRLTAITPVALDHQSFLGDEIEAIAAEKAGILKPAVEAVLGPQTPEALAVIEARAAAIGAPVRRFGRDWDLHRCGDGVRFRGEVWDLPLENLSLAGAHQFENAGLALACLERLTEFGVGEAAAKAGLAGARWGGRLQRLAAPSLTAKLPEGWSLWADGGHNPHAAAALAAWAADRKEPVHLIAGLLATKNPQGFTAPFAGIADSLTAVPVPGHEMVAPDLLAATATAAGIPASASVSVEAAVDRLARAGGPPATILICGSLYLIGAVLAGETV